jgi:hypothetical protein
VKKYFVALKNVSQAVSEMPEVQATVTVLGGAFALSGWIVADINRRKINELESIDKLTDNWDTIKINPSMMEDVRNGATLTYRQKRLSPGNLYTQGTTRPGGFSEEMNKEFEETSLDTVSKWFEEKTDA